MKKLLKVILPPFTGFLIFFLGIRYSSVYFELKIDEMGLGDLKSFMSFYRYTMPLLFVVAVLTQLLIVLPCWRSLITKSLKARIFGVIGLLFVCTLFASGISYAIWDPLRGVHYLLKLIAFLSAVQTFYWFINLLVLYGLERSSS